MTDTLAPKKSTEISVRAKFARFILGFLQVIMGLLAFICFIQLCSEFLISIGVDSDDAGIYVWGIIIGIIVLAGWALEARND